MNSIHVKKFWMKPEPLPHNAKEFSFGYTEQNDKEREYNVKVKGNDLKSFHEFVFKIMDAKNKKILPWFLIAFLKNKVNIVNPKAESEQTELNLKANKLARSFSMKSLASTIKEFGMILTSDLKKWEKFDEKLWFDKHKKTMAEIKEETEDKEDYNEADNALRNTKIGVLFDEIETNARKLPAGSDYSGPDYLKQELMSPEIKKFWDIYTKSSFKDAAEVIEIVNKIEDWAKKKIKELK